MRCCVLVCLLCVSAAVPSPQRSNAQDSANSQKKQRTPTRIRDADRRKSVKISSWTELKRQRVVMQQRDFSCGAASLATLLKYHIGDDVTETQLLVEVVKMLSAEEMRERYENGLSLTDLRRLAVRLGYLSTIGKLKFEDLKKSKVPLIVGIVIQEFDHFVVFRGADDRYVYLADPARGQVRTPIPEFLKQWQENAILVVVKRGQDVSKRSPYLVDDDESSLGKTNDLFMQRQLSAPNVRNSFPK